MGCCFSSGGGGHRKRPVTSTSQLPQSRADSSQTTGYSTSVASRRGDGGAPPNSIAISVGVPIVTSALARSKKEGESNEIVAARHAQQVAEDRLREVMLFMEGVARERDAAVARELATRDSLARCTSASSGGPISTRTGAEAASRLLGLLRTHLGGEE